MSSTAGTISLASEGEQASVYPMTHEKSRLPTVGVFAKATPQDTPKAVVTKTDEPMRRFDNLKESINVHFKCE